MVRRHKGKVPRLRDQHTIDRAKERYDLDLTDQDLVELACKVRADEGAFLKRHSGSKTEWLLKWEGAVIRVIYSTGTQQIVTILPLPLVSDEILQRMCAGLYKER